MNKYFVFTILSVFIVLLGFAGSAVAQDRGDRVCLYNEENFSHRVGSAPLNPSDIKTMASVDAIQGSLSLVAEQQRKTNQEEL